MKQNKELCECIKLISDFKATVTYWSNRLEDYKNKGIYRDVWDSLQQVIDYHKKEISKAMRKKNKLENG